MIIEQGGGGERPKTRNTRDVQGRVHAAFRRAVLGRADSWSSRLYAPRLATPHTRSGWGWRVWVYTIGLLDCTIPTPLPTPPLQLSPDQVLAALEAAAGTAATASDELFARLEHAMKRREALAARKARVAVRGTRACVCFVRVCVHVCVCVCARARWNTCARLYCK